MFHDSGRGLKRKANGTLRGSREQMLREFQPSWYVDARMRKSLKNLLALDDGSPEWSDGVWMSASADRGRHFICAGCGSTGAHVLGDDLSGKIFYRCLECGGKGVTVNGGVSAVNPMGFGSDRRSDEIGAETHCGCDRDDLDDRCGMDSSDEEEEDGSEYLPGGSEDESDCLPGQNEESAGEETDDPDEIGDDEVDDGTNMNDPVVVTFHPETCDNCHRKSIGTRNRFGRIDPRCIRLKKVWLPSGAFQRRHATMGFGVARILSRNYRKKQVQLKLCQQCARTLTRQPSKTDEEDVWPALMWNWLTDRRLMRRFGTDLWKVVPLEWRHWWIDAITECDPIYEKVTVDSPMPVFTDVTDRKRELERGIGTMRASIMRQVCNDHLFPLVRCPWGCSEYYHKCGLLSFDLVVRKLFGPAVKPVLGEVKYVRNGDPKMDGMAPDYGNVHHVPLLLGNALWKVCPSIAFVDGVPRVLSCRSHGGGSSGKCLYPPRNPHGILPSSMGDQIAPAAVRPRNVKQFKAHSYSDTYQMSEMQGQFAGVDTFHLTSRHDFTSESTILQRNEALAMNGRRDLVSMVTEWGDPKSGILPHYVSEDLLRHAAYSGLPDNVVEECCGAATYITLSDAVKLHRVNKERKGRVVQTKVDHEIVQSHYVPRWPSATIHVHPFTPWGSEFPLLPATRHDQGDCHLLWSLGGMLIGIPSLWEKTDKIVYDVGEWHGWLLTYLTSTCFPRACSGARDRNPFKFRHAKYTVDRLRELLIRMGMSAPSDEDSAVGDDSSVAGDDAGSKDEDSQGESLIFGSEDGSSLNTDRVASDDSSSASDSVGNFSDARPKADFEESDEDGSSRMSEVVGNFSVGEEVSQDADGSSCMSEVIGNFSIDGEVLEGAFEASTIASESADGAGDDNGIDELSIFSLGSVEDETGEPELHTDGVFHAEDIEILMSRYDDVEVLADTDYNSDTSFAKSSSDVAILYSCDGRSDFPAENIFREDGIGMELRFVSGRQLIGERASEFAFMRHGGGALTNWWVQRQDGSVCLQDSTESTDLGEGEKWHFAVYVSDANMSVEQCRDLMLNSMGVRQHVRCREHDLPLITAPFRSKEGDRICCSGMPQEHCSGRLMCCCPVKGCAVAVCLKHKGKVYESEDTVYLSTLHDENDDNASVMVCQSVDGCGEDGSNVSLDSAQLDWLGPNPWAEHEIPGDGESENSSERDEVCATGNIEVPLEIKGDPVSLPGCVVLNNVGSLLARKRSKGKPSSNYKHFMERLVATAPGRSVPLVYPEAMLFPSLFWKDDGTEGSLLGALPSGALAHSDTLAKFGIADLTKQIRSRVTNPAIGMGADPRYLCYAFDTIVNLGCRHEDTRVILHRGIVGTETGIALREENSSHFNVDSVDSRPTVNKLAAAVAKKQVTYFFTHTPNATDHFGLAPIRNWVCSEEGVLANGGNLDDYVQCEEIQLALRQAAGVLLLRNWMETAVIYMRYISDSPEHPLGAVEHIWWRFEFQDAVGNLPHIHALLWLKEGSEDPDVTENRIRGSIIDLLSADEIDELIAEGLLSCRDEAMEVKELATRLLAHVCSSRCQRRIGLEDNDLKCRVTDNARESPDCTRYCTREVNICHSGAAYTVLEELGLFVQDPNGDGFVPVEDVFKASKHYPPADPSDGKVSACNGRLFVLTRSNQNLKIMTGYLASRYLAKYLALIDENNRVYIGSMSQERNTVKVEKEVLHNTKITGSAIMEAERDAKKRAKSHPKGRAISHMEMLCVILGYPQVYTDLEFFHIPTVPLEERPTVERNAPIKKLLEEKIVSPDNVTGRAGDLDAGDAIPSWQIRNEEWKVDLPAWRTWSDVESLSLRDQCLCPLALDAISIFSVRPPELRWVRKPKLYFRWFYRDIENSHDRGSFQKRLTYLSKVLDCTYEECGWVDGTDCRVYVREAAVPEILEYLRFGGTNRSHRSHASFYPTGAIVPDKGSFRLVHGTDKKGRPTVVRSGAAESPYRDVFDLFSTIYTWQLTPPRHARIDQVERWDFLQERFLGRHRDDEKIQRLPVIWFNSVKPTEPVRWLVHMLISMGEFDCEASLLGCGNMVENFTRAGLLREGTAHRQEDVKILARRYAEEQLVYLPGGTYQFDKHLVQAREVLQTVLVDENMPPTEMPAGLYTHLQHSTEKKVQKYREQARDHLCDVLWADVKATGMFDMHFTKADLKRATPDKPIEWRPDLRRTALQSEASYAEQKLVVDSAVTAIIKYQNFLTSHPKGVIAAGGPGSGKTSCLQSIGLVARSRGLNVGLATVMSERGQQLGGIHFARFCKFPGTGVTNPCRLAELAIAKLMRSPKELEYIRSLDVLLIDEMGQVSAEMLSALDIIFRRVRNNSSFFGGMLVFASMDAMQLRPVEGRPPLLSPQMTTCFHFFPLDHSVRAAQCPALQRLVQICRLGRSELTEDIHKEFVELITRNCTFVSNWDDPRLQPDMLRMFATHSARREAEGRLMAAIRKRYGSQLVVANSTDQEASLEGNWVGASSATSRLLTRQVKEPCQLYFYPGARYEITYNKQGHYSQSQLAVLAEVPTPSQVRSLDPVRVYVAPEGTKAISRDLQTGEDFLRAGFRIDTVGEAPSRIKYIGLGFQAKRIQYGLRHRIAATIHAGMGQDLPSVITKVDGADKYRLFQREQAVVLLSRTHFARDIYFVGSPNQTAEVLWEALNERSVYDAYLEYLMKKLTNKPTPDGYQQDINLAYFHPCRPIDCGLPQDSSGFAYVLASVHKNYIGKATYIGQAENLNARFLKHKAGTATDQTADPRMRPWVMLAYISGFEGCSKSGRMYFEALWQGTRNKRNAQRSTPLTPDQIADLGRMLVDEKKYTHCIELQDKELRFHRCGVLRPGLADPKEKP